MASDVDSMQKTFVNRIALYLLCTMALLRLTAGRNCTDLIVYDGERMLTAARVNKSEDCSNGLEGFPDELASGESVSKARDFQVVPYSTKTAADHTVYGVSLTWKVPLPGNSRKHLKGFYLEMEKVGTATKLCTNFDMRNINMTNSPDMHFSYSCTFENTNDETYRVLLLSLPPPSDREYEQGLHDRTGITVPASRDQSEVDPADWRTWVSVRLYSAESKIQVTFGYPENDSLARFDSYLVELRKCTCDDGNRNTDLVTKVNVQSTFPSKTFGEYNFTNVSSGTYKVLVVPESGDNCQCYYVQSGYNKCAFCKISSTELFNFTTSEEVTSTKTTAPPAENNALVGSAVGVPLALAALLFAAICLWKQYKSAKRADLGRDDTGVESAHEGSQSVSSRGTFSLFPLVNRSPAPPIKEKSVLLLTSEDHEYFSQALNTFAVFLRLHCQCDVMFAPQQLSDVRETENNWVWLYDQMGQADFTVIVASAKAASPLCQAFHKDLECRSTDPRSEGDIWRRGARHIYGKIDRDTDVSKVIMVYFEHTSTEHRLPDSVLPPCFYRLPTHLKPFLLHLHDLDETTMDLLRVNLPLQGNVEELVGGREWLDAAEKCSAICRPSSYLSRDSGFGEGGPFRSHFPYEFGSPPDREPSWNDFIPPSPIDTGSITTVPYPFSLLSDKPLEIDDGCGTSQGFRDINRRYEEDRIQEQEQDRHPQLMEAVARQLRLSAVSDRTNFAHDQKKLDCPHGDFGPPEVCDSDTNSVCLSVLSVASV